MWRSANKGKDVGPGDSRADDGDLGVPSGPNLSCRDGSDLNSCADQILASHARIRSYRALFYWRGVFLCTGLVFSGQAVFLRSRGGRRALAVVGMTSSSRRQESFVKKRR